MKYTAIAVGVVVLGTVAVLLFYKPADPVVPLPVPDPPHVIDPNALQTAGDHPDPNAPQKYAALPPRQVPLAGSSGMPGNAAMPPSVPGGLGGIGVTGKGVGAGAGPPVEGGAGDGGKAKRFAPDKDGIRAAMREAIPEIRECYDSWLATNPTLGGKLTMSFSIMPNDAGGGSVQDLSVSSKDISHLPFEGCVKNVMAGMQFDTPFDDSTGDPGPMKVNYPLVFSSNDAG